MSPSDADIVSPSCLGDTEHDWQVAVSEAGHIALLKGAELKAVLHTQLEDDPEGIVGVGVVAVIEPCQRWVFVGEVVDRGKQAGALGVEGEAVVHVQRDVFIDCCSSAEKVSVIVVAVGVPEVQAQVVPARRR